MELMMIHCHPKLQNLLIRNGWTIAAAESLTAGLFMAELASEPGISSSLEGGIDRLQ